MKIKSLLCSTMLVFAAITAPASANIVYTFSGASFDDGGSLTGTFTTDDSISSLLDYDITTSGGTLAGFHYTPGSTDSFSSLPTILVLETSGLEHLIQVTFSGGLTTTGALITIGQFDSFEQDPTGAHRQITGGEAIVAAVPGVPEPITLSLFGAGLIGATAMRLRRK
jgi:hypothetical protein